MTTRTMTNGALAVSPVRVDAATALVRVIAGSVFAAHGAQKLFVWGLEGVAGGFASMGIPMAGVAGPAVAFLEFFGGIALAVGLLTRLVSTGLAVVMLGALFMVHLSAGFFAPNGIEFVLTLFAIAAGLAIAGPGRYSLDALIAARRGA
ncbi:MAG TPA: DoxX family protein [Longimicrobiales bacterium]